MLTNENIICLSSVDWEPLWTRKQQVMSRLPHSNKILYVEPPITLLSPFKDPEMWKKWGMWRQGVRRLNDFIYLWSPPPILPFGNKYRWINKCNQWLIAKALKPVIKQLELTDPILWTYMPNSGDIIDQISHKLLVYDCVDEHSEYTGLIDKENMLSMEQDLIKACDTVFVTAEGLYQSKKPFAKTIYFLPNAANVEHFMQAQKAETQIPPELQDLPGPVIGFVGVIQDWIDLELIEMTARTHPEWSVVLVGPVGPGIDISALQQLSNVHLLGRKDLKDLPKYLKGFDVCLNPFKMNELTDKVSPLKFYEYLASGKPIVTVDMPGIRDFVDVVEVAKTREEWIPAIERALSQESPEKLEQRLKRARENSWESRVEFMMDKLAPQLARSSVTSK